MTRAHNKRWKPKQHRHARINCPVCNADRGDVMHAVKTVIPAPNSDRDSEENRKALMSCVLIFERVRHYLIHGEIPDEGLEFLP